MVLGISAARIQLIAFMHCSDHFFARRFGHNSRDFSQLFSSSWLGLVCVVFRKTISRRFPAGSSGADMKDARMSRDGHC